MFHGVAFGAKKDALGEVVFNTGMSGYQEILTDPSYAGQFVVLTTAEVGNYGINGADTESRALFLSGLVIGDLTEPSNWRSEKSLDKYLEENGVPGIYGVDTRALTIHIREHGNRKAYLCVGRAACPQAAAALSARAPYQMPAAALSARAPYQMSAFISEDDAIAKAREWVGLDGQDYAARVTRANVELWKCGNVELCKSGNEADGSHKTISTIPQFQNSAIPQFHIPHIVCYDFGVKTNILRSLASWAKVTVVPAKTPAEEVLAMNPDGVFLSNGPADPAAVTYAIENIRKLLGFECLSCDGLSSHSSTAKELKHSNTQKLKNSKLPIMGICLGHQLLSLACGAKTARLKFGHHGCNHPVKNLATGKVEITSQNHNFAVVPESVPDCLEVTHINLNDGSIEGVRHKTLPAFSVQYHPESCPGPHDSSYLFNQFKQMILTVKNM